MKHQQQHFGKATRYLANNVDRELNDLTTSQNKLSEMKLGKEHITIALKAVVSVPVLLVNTDQWKLPTIDKDEEHDFTDFCRASRTMAKFTLPTSHY